MVASTKTRAADIAREQIPETLDKVRHARHQPDCRCGLYRIAGAPYCTTEEFRWSSMLDRLISKITEPPS